MRGCVLADEMRGPPAACLGHQTQGCDRRDPTTAKAEPDSCGATGSPIHRPPQRVQVQRPTQCEASVATSQSTEHGRSVESCTGCPKKGQRSMAPSQGHESEPGGLAGHQRTSGETGDRMGTEESYLQGKDPLIWAAEHFAEIFREARGAQEVEWRREQNNGRPFSVEEIRSVIQKGKSKRAVGLDLTSYELAKALCQSETSEQALLAWMESVRMGAEVPQAWLTTILTLLPKKAKPATPGDLRPISLGSCVGKIFGGLLLQRTRAVLLPQGPGQCALGGRQTADYLFSVMKTFAVETEWKFGLKWLRIDINKAYDSIHRGKILEYLERVLPATHYREFQAWKQMLRPGCAHVRTPWGSQTISQTRGIRQGSVESPFIFAIAMECALHKAQESPQWPKTLSCAPDMDISSLLFMDDSIIWDNRAEKLILKYDLFRQALSEWGLTVNPRKTLFYSSPHSADGSSILVEGVNLTTCQTFEVMGVQLSIPLKPASIMDTGMAKARKKFHAMSHILECRGNLQERLKVFRSAVGGAALWYGAAASPGPQAMGALNTMQLEMVARMSGLRRKTEESWLHFRQRSMRAARQILCNAGHERWSTVWLRRHWQYRGHVARAAAREQPPASSHLDQFRTLKWWRGQQRWKDGVRHPEAFYPHLSNEENPPEQGGGGGGLERTCETRQGMEAARGTLDPDERCGVVFGQAASAAGVNEEAQRGGQ